MTQREALAILKTGANVFLTGEPGSGKTYVINAFVEWLTACGIEPSITAATGIAATHIHGMTLHSWSGIGATDGLSRAEVDRIAQKEPVVRRLGKAHVLIIDEVSMLGAGVLDAVDAVCREVRRSEAPFGGLTVVLVGDFFQLPPIARAGSAARFCYESASWRALNPIVCYLGEQYRQEDDAYLEILTAIRTGAVEQLHYERLTARRPLDHQALGNAPKLYSHNADVDRINAEELAKLPGAVKRFTMTSAGRAAMIEALQRGCLSPELLELTEGAAVMFTKNSPQGRFVNGSLGVVTGFDRESGYPVVELRSPSTSSGYRQRITVEPVDWQVVEEGKVRATITQVPLRLAYAMTVHKSQGMSMDAAVVDLSRAFEYGQGYVALSRVRRLAGLHLLGLNARALEVHPAVAEADRGFKAASVAAARTFEAMESAELEGLQKNFVKAAGGEWVAAGQVKEEAKKRKTRAAKAAAQDRYAETLTLIKAGTPLAEIAAARGVTAGTVVAHIEKLLERGSLVAAEVSYLMPSAEALGQIRTALASAEDERLAPIYYKLGKRHSYEAIRLARLAQM